MKNKVLAQITLETAIVMPIVMVIVAVFISISLYVYDVITIKSYVYSFATEHRNGNLEDFTKFIRNRVTRIPLFVSKVEETCFEENEKYKVVIYAGNNDKTGLLRMFFNKSKTMTIKVEKKINVDIMYASRAIFDKLE